MARWYEGKIPQSLDLIHVQNCIARIRDYPQGGKAEFIQNGMVQDAVLHNLEINGGELVKGGLTPFQREAQRSQPLAEAHLGTEGGEGRAWGWGF